MLSQTILIRLYSLYYDLEHIDVSGMCSAVRAMLTCFVSSQAGSSAAAWMPLLYDSVVIGLTLGYILPKVRERPATVILKRLLQDGVLYYVYVRRPAA
jgi:hypothetical protein